MVHSAYAVLYEVCSVHSVDVQRATRLLRQGAISRGAQALRSGADGITTMVEPQSEAEREARQRIYEQVTQLEEGSSGRDRRPQMDQRMRERRGDGSDAGPPFTATPRRAQDHVVHVHSITCLTKTKAKHV